MFASYPNHNIKNNKRTFNQINNIDDTPMFFCKKQKTSENRYDTPKSIKSTDFYILRILGTNMYQIVISNDFVVQNNQQIQIVEKIPVFNPNTIYTNFMANIQKNTLCYPNKWMSITNMSDDYLRHLLYQTIKNTN